ncbi:hypothetical protein BDW_10290 [Bdellovibrio bacteriovorus W]|nr:hypothetical protein BDW_10290 [Bdellovibrio bacteriovorus W]
MKTKIFAIFAIVFILNNGAISVASAQGQKKPSVSTHSMEGMNMMGMMDMMSSCSRMMQGGAMGHMLPQLPPGNEKLQMKMHAEVMQKIGEIETKYADLIK